jgi:hypothetical protein
VDGIKLQIDHLSSCQETNSDSIIDSLKHEIACGLASAAISLAPRSKTQTHLQQCQHKPTPNEPEEEEPEGGRLKELNGYFECLDESG